MPHNTSSKDPLQYLGVEAVNPPNVFRETRAPVGTDNSVTYRVGDIWVDTVANDVYMLTERNDTAAVWVLTGAAGGALNTLSINTGGTVVTPVASNIDFRSLSAGLIWTSPGAGIIEISASGFASSFPADVGTATPAAGVVNIFGGPGIDTTGAANTISINIAADVARFYNTDVGGPAVPALNTLVLAGGTGIITTGAGDTVTFDVDGTVGQTITGDIGVAQPPVAGNWRIQGTNVSGSGIRVDTSVPAPRVDLRMSSPYTLSDFSFETSAAAAVRELTVQAPFDVAASRASMRISVGGPLADDAYTEYEISGARNYAFGIDNAAIDTLNITTAVGSVTPSGGTRLWTMSPAGERVMPLQPAFHAFLSASDVAVTGDGTVFTLGSGGAFTERFDQGGNFVPATGVFTAPVSGIYCFTVRVTVGSLTAPNDSMIVNVVTTPTTYQLVRQNPDAGATPTNDIGLQGTVVCFMSTFDTATFNVAVFGGGAGSVDVEGNAPGIGTYVMGYLLV